jgi:phospholipid N-methyltransferase
MAVDGRIRSTDAIRSVEDMNNSTTPHDRDPLQRNAGTWTFVREAARDPRTVGAVAPSGASLARSLTDPVEQQGRRALDILEVGAGTGSVTRALLSRLSPGSRLDIVEANPRFAAQLTRLVGAHPPLGGCSDQARVHETRVEGFATERRYDLIVSGLPFTNFGATEVEAIMDRYLELLRPGGTLTYFAYKGTRYARALSAGRSEADRHRAVEEVLSTYQRRYATDCRSVWRNLPPATVWQLGRPPLMTTAVAGQHETAATSR